MYNVHIKCLGDSVRNTKVFLQCLYLEQFRITTATATTISIYVCVWILFAVKMLLWNCCSYIEIYARQLLDVVQINFTLLFQCFSCTKKRFFFLVPHTFCHSLFSFFSDLLFAIIIIIHFRLPFPTNTMLPNWHRIQWKKSWIFFLF